MGCSSGVAGAVDRRPAPLEGRDIDQAPNLISVFWLKNAQLNARHTVRGAGAAMNGLSTGSSTVFVRKPEGRA
ncbi:hypothetical protein D3C72_2287000 [compost metagenome]